MTEAPEIDLDASLNAAADLVRRSTRIAVTAHVNPDADAIGSVLGISLGLRTLGKDVIPALSDPIPRYAQFLGGSDTIVNALQGRFDLLVCADAADIERIGTLYEDNRSLFAATPILNIDHHHTNPRYGLVNHVHGKASSTSEMAFHLLCALGVQIDADIATALLFGIVGDTGSFRNAATTPGSLEVAGRLVASGADIERVCFQLFEWKTFSAVKVWGSGLSSADLDPERCIVFAYISQAMLQGEGGSMDETEGVAEFLRGVEEAETVMLLKESPEGEIRVSMRSRPAVDVSAIATALGGGGHRQAAGCTLAGPMPAARKQLVEAYDRVVRR